MQKAPTNNISHCKFAYGVCILLHVTMPISYWCNAVVLNIIALSPVLIIGISSIIQPELLLSSFVSENCYPLYQR